MAFLLSCLLLLSSFASRSAQPIINLGSSLSPTSPPWHSPSRRFAFGFYPEGGGFSIGVWLVTSPGNITVIWTALRDVGPFADDTVLTLTTEGLKLHLPNSNDQQISKISATASNASMFDSGNFVIHGAGSAPLWQTFDNPTDTIMGGQELSSDHKLVSSVSETNHSEGRFLLRMQNNGGLWMYPVDTRETSQDAYWNSYTNNKGYTSLFLDINGHMYLSGGNDTKNLTGGNETNLTGGNETSPALIYRATLGADGIFRLYSHNLARRSVLVLARFPNTGNRCEIHGVCGMNSYCNLTDGRPVCLCFPGFDYIDTHETSSGCSRNFTYSCWGNGDNETFSMSSLESVGWLDDPYTILPLKSKDECSDACLEDCNCNAVLYYYNGGKCNKQKFPLRYGWVDSIEITVAYIKVATKKPAQGSAAIEGVKKGLSSEFLIVTSLVTVGLVITIVVLGLYVCRYRAGRYRRIWRNRELGLANEIGPRSFSYKELWDATGGFKEEIGKGSFGTVFRGRLSGGEVITAVKRLEKVVEEGEREFRTEMRVIGRTHHRNLVRLLGFCDEGLNRLLAYEYMSNGSLAELIFKPESRPQWTVLVRISLDVAKGIHYLHEECETRIIHCDIKPQNILMDKNWTAKISDFGLAKLLMPSQTRTFTGIRGTRGYLAPEWHKNAPISVKADVYSFGVVLLEVVCCRRSLEAEADLDEIVLLEWVCNCFVRGELMKLVEDDEVEVWELERLVKVGLWCIQDDPALRPYMKNVVMMLEGNIEVPVPPLPSSSSMSPRF